jgi:hypothetical protein
MAHGAVGVVCVTNLQGDTLLVTKHLNNLCILTSAPKAHTCSNEEAQWRFSIMQQQQECSMEGPTVIRGRSSISQRHECFQSFYGAFSCFRDISPRVLMFANPIPMGLACLNHAKLWTFAKFRERVIVSFLDTISLL